MHGPTDARGVEHLVDALQFHGVILGQLRVDGDEVIGSLLVDRKVQVGYVVLDFLLHPIERLDPFVRWNLHVVALGPMQIGGVLAAAGHLIPRAHGPRPGDQVADFDTHGADQRAAFATRTLEDEVRVDHVLLHSQQDHPDHPARIPLRVAVQRTHAQAFAAGHAVVQVRLPVSLFHHSVAQRCLFNLIELDHVAYAGHCVLLSRPVGRNQSRTECHSVPDGLAIRPTNIAFNLRFGRRACSPTPRPEGAPACGVRWPPTYETGHARPPRPRLRSLCEPGPLSCD